MLEHIIHLEDGRLAADTDSAHVDKIVANACGSERIAIHFHGGLVSQASGLEIVNRVKAYYTNGGAYPLFFVWESGLLEILPNKLRTISEEGIFRSLWERLARLAQRKLEQAPGQRATGLPALVEYAPARSIRPALEVDRTEVLVEPEALRRATPLTPAEELQARAELERDLALQAELAALVPASEAGPGTRNATPLGERATTLMDPEVLQSLRSGGGPGTRGLLSASKLAAAAVQVLARVLKRFWTERDHGFHATIVEELLRAFYLGAVGKATWDLIKSNTVSAFGADPRVHGGTAVVDSLRRQLAGRAPRITLIGHSTGAIYISDWLDHATRVLPPEVKFEIVFLAAASTFERTADSLQRHASRITQLRAFAMTDPNERGDQLVPVVYPHSLLYFVSGVLEAEPDEPIVGMQRYFTGAQYDAASFPKLEAVRAFFAGPPDRNVWSDVDEVDGRRSGSLKHGDFDNDPRTLTSLQHILQNGF